MSKFASLDEAFGDARPKTHIVYENAGLQAERDFITTEVVYNRNYSNYLVKNYRQVNTTKNPDYRFRKDTVYELQGIEDGKGPGMNINIDDKLTRRNLTSKPIDRLAEATNTFYRTRDFFPKDYDIYHNQFLVSTTLAKKPQTMNDPVFERYGKSTRHWNRKPEDFFKKYSRF